MKVYVLGAGSFGCVIANIVSSNGYDTFLWSYDEAEKLRQTRENPYIKGAKINGNIDIIDNMDNVEEADLIVVVVPSFAVLETCKSLNEKIKTKKDFLVCTKGLDAKTKRSAKEIIIDEVKNINHIATLSGPTHAEELAFEKYTTIVSTSKDLEFAKKIQKMFSTKYLRVYTNTDEKGVELLGAAKNVLAIAGGVCDSSEKLGDNAKAALITRGIRELIKIGEMQGAKSETFYGLTGLGDLLVTAFSRHSRNRKFGELIGKGYSIEEAQKEVGMVVEGLYSVEALHDLTIDHEEEYPIINSIYEVAFNNATIDGIVEKIFERESKSEN